MTMLCRRAHTPMSPLNWVLSSFSRKNSIYVKKRSYRLRIIGFNASDTISRRNANASVTCPVEQGDYVVTQTVTLPKEIPQGMYKSLRFGISSDSSFSKIRCWRPSLYRWWWRPLLCQAQGGFHEEVAIFQASNNWLIDTCRFYLFCSGTFMDQDSGSCSCVLLMSPHLLCPALDPATERWESCKDIGSNRI